MSPALHPPEELWFDYAAAQVAPALRTLLEAHLAYCEPCRVLAGAGAAAGASALKAEPDAAEPGGLLAGILARAQAPVPPKVAGKALPLPAPLWPLLPDLSGAAWRGALTRGFRFLPVLELSGQCLFLVHLEAGRPFPAHDHRGLERSLVLAGGLATGEGVLEPGDFQEVGPGHLHAPVALADGDCWLLASVEGGILFKGWRGLLQRLAGQ